MNPDLWRIDRYRDFLAARRELLAQAANDFLDSLLAGSLPGPDVVILAGQRSVVYTPGGVVSDGEELLLLECNEWVEQRGLPAGEFMYELTDAENGEAVAIVDLAWPDGLQVGYSQPVALLIDEGREIEEVVNQAGYRYFTDVNTFRAYVQEEILALEPEL